MYITPSVIMLVYYILKYSCTTYYDIIYFTSLKYVYIQCSSLGLKLCIILKILIMFSLHNCPVFYRLINFIISIKIIIGKVADGQLSQTTAIAG